MRDDGRIYVRVGSDGYPVWLTPEALHRTRISTVWHHAKKRARLQCVPFAVTKSELADIFPADHTCPVLGVRLEFGGGMQGRDNSPSLDRVIPATGYTPSNLRWISNRANTLKRDATLPELEALVSYMKSNIE